MKKRRGHGEGSIHRRKDGLYQGAIVTPEGRKYVWAKTERECIAKVREMQKNADLGLPPVPSKLTLIEYLTGYKRWPALNSETGEPIPPLGWLGTVAKLNTRPNVYRVYESIVRIHVLPALGSKKLASLTARDIQALYAAKSVAPPSGREHSVSPGTIKHIAEVLHNALNVAVQWGYVPRNVAAAARAPRIAREEPTPLQPSEARALVSAIRGDPWEALYVVAITTGLRQSEILGLKWQDVDLDPGRSPGSGETFSECPAWVSLRVSRRARPAAGLSPCTPSPLTLCVATAPARSKPAWPLAPFGTTRAWSSQTRSESQWRQATSRAVTTSLCCSKPACPKCRSTDSAIRRPPSSTSWAQTRK